MGAYSWQEDADYYDEHGNVIEHVATRTVPWDLCKTIYKQMATMANGSPEMELDTTPQPPAVPDSFDKSEIAESLTDKLHDLCLHTEMGVVPSWSDLHDTVIGELQVDVSPAVPDGFDVTVRHSDGAIIVTRLSDGGAAIYEKSSPLVTSMMAYRFISAMLAAAQQGGK